mgnify:CR=1 FL=1
MLLFLIFVIIIDIIFLVSIEPCTTTEVIVKLNLDFKMNFYSLIMNRKLTIFYYDVDDVEELGKIDMDWNKLPINYLGRNEINVDYNTTCDKY